MTDMDLYLAELVTASLEKRIPPDVPKGLSVEELIKYAKKNGIKYLVYNSLVKTSVSEEIKNQLQMVVEKSIFRSGLQICEYADITKAFEENKVLYQPLKGIVLKQIYPNPFMREMKDIDLLIQESCMDTASEILCRMGYELTREIHHHDVYKKKPFVTLEAHRTRYDATVDQNQFSYYKEFYKAIKDKNSECRYVFSNEDFYVYMLSHMAKHFYQMGCGIRNLVDIYVFNKKYSGFLNRNYIDEELEKCGIDTFAKHMERMTDIWLNKEESSEFYDNLFSYMLQSGVQGKDENGIWNEFAREKGENKRAYKKRLYRFYLFPPFHYMVKYHPWLEKKKVLLPFAWTGRLIYFLFHKKGDRKLHMLHEISDQEVRIIQDIYCRMQFDFQA